MRNVPPTVTVSANPATLPQGGGTTTISVNATDPAGTADPLKYSVDCNGDSDFTDAGDVASKSATTPPFTHPCTFAAAPAETQVVHTVNVKVDDGDGPVTPGQVNVPVGEAQLEDWTGSLDITGKLSGGGNLTGNPKLTFGIRPGCTSGFELKNSTNQDCDVSGSKIASPDELQAVLYYPKNTPSDFFDTQKLPTSRIAPPSPETETLMFPVRVEVSKSGATEVDVTIKWDIGDQTKIPTEYITVLLIDHSPESPLPPFNDTNIGKSATGVYTFQVKLAAGKATRDFTVVATRSQVQTMRLTTGPQVMSLSVKPLFGSTVADIFTFTGPNRRSVTEDPLLLVLPQFVTTWNHDFAKSEAQRLRGLVFVGDARHPEMQPGFGYLVTLAPLDGKFRDVMLIIPGSPIVENTRTSN